VAPTLTVRSERRRRQEICVAQTFVRTPVHFQVVRSLLGACEAGFYLDKPGHDGAN
jgi:hypothetical protein